MEDVNKDIGFAIVGYSSQYEDEWDKMVEEDSANGTFLQTRRFIGYHPAGRFEEFSMVVTDPRGQVAAVVPGNLVNKDNAKVFVSYGGATFGGIVVRKKYYKAKYVIPFVRMLKEYLLQNGISEAYIKTTPDIFSVYDSSLLEYAFYYNGFEEYKELSTVISYDTYGENVISNLSQGKRTHVHRCEREHVHVEYISDDVDVVQYYGILCENLEKYHVKPVHSLDELLDFKNNRLREECEFIGTYYNGEMVAGGMLFKFEDTGVVHTQYLSERRSFLKLSPMTYTYYWLIGEMKRRGFSRLSWGNTTEQRGKVINMGLVNSKEDYGSGYTNNLTYHIVF